MDNYRSFDLREITSSKSAIRIEDFIRSIFPIRILSNDFSVEEALKYKQELLDLGAEFIMENYPDMDLSNAHNYEEVIATVVDNDIYYGRLKDFQTVLKKLNRKINSQRYSHNLNNTRLHTMYNREESLNQFYKKIASQVKFKKANENSNLHFLVNFDAGWSSPNLFLDKADGSLVIEWDLDAYDDEFRQEAAINGTNISRFYEDKQATHTGINEQQKQQLISKAKSLGADDQGNEYYLGPNDSYIFRVALDNSGCVLYK